MGTSFGFNTLFRELVAGNCVLVWTLRNNMINREKLSGVKDKFRRAERILVIETLSSLSKIVYFIFQVFGESRS